MGENPKKGFGLYPMESEEGRAEYDRLRSDELSLLGIKSSQKPDYRTTKSGVTAAGELAVTIAKIQAESKGIEGKALKDLYELELKKTEGGRKLYQDAVKYAKAKAGEVGDTKNFETYISDYIELQTGTRPADIEKYKIGQTATNPTTGEVVTWDGRTWVNGRIK